ncbi:MAG: hypothetical protein A2Y53_02640 [Chloroflexi bacterium RBG_16_47_49]|nr:MAG: hypothetical protein A2Y53_02640 [Chloroflexi bacterium RBG_16_47_49]
MDATQTPPAKTRYGFYYYPDTVHYSENDIHTWLPELKALGASWLTLLAPTDRAIPELFIRRIIEAGIQPVLHLPLSTTRSGGSDELNVLFNAYAHWGVKYITLFDRPNLLKNWSPSNWAKNNLVDRFLDSFIPIAEDARQAGLIPAFPPLEPGGDYWDTAFLFAALQGLQRRGHMDLLNQLALSAYAWSGNRSPNWGAGGPERWPSTRPYLTPQNSEDHLGFRIFDWYLAVSEAAIGIQCPILLLAAGSMIGDQLDPRSPAVDIHAHTWQNMTLVQLMSGRSQEFDPVPPQVICCNFWLLSTVATDGQLNNAWYKPDNTQLPVVSKLKEWVANGGTDPSSAAKSILSSKMSHDGLRPISHYLLLPNFEWGAADWHLEAIRPFIKKYQPTIGFSPVEASHAKKVTVIGGASSIPESIIDGLLAAGCIVEQINPDGMNIAS